MMRFTDMPRDQHLLVNLCSLGNKHFLTLVQDRDLHRTDFYQHWILKFRNGGLEYITRSLPCGVLTTAGALTPSGMIS